MSKEVHRIYFCKDGAILDTQIKAECKEHQETMKVADKTINKLEKALELAVDYMFDELNIKGYKDIHYDGNDLTLLQENINYFKTKAEEIIKSENLGN